MAELSQPLGSQSVAAGIAEREAAENAVRAQNDEASRGRSDTQAAQLSGARDVAFNPASDPQAAAGSSQVAAQLPGSGQSGGLQGASGVAALPGSAGRAGLSQTQPEGEWESLIDAAKGLGYQFPAGVADDRSALMHVLGQAQRNQEADYYAQLGRQLAPHYQGIQSYLQQQKPAQPAQRPEWEAPEFDQKMLALVDRDPASGVFLAKPGVNPAVADAVNQYDRWYQKYGLNPQAAVRPMLEAELPKMLGNVIETKFAEWQRQQTISGIVQRNAEWMYQTGSDGRPQIGVGGQPLPTPEGMRYSQIVGQLERGGMSDPALVDQLARNMLLGEIAQGQLKATRGQVAPAQQQAALASGRPQSNVLQSLMPQDRQGTIGATEPDQTGLSLAEKLRNNLTTAGFTDADFQQFEFGN